MGIRLKSGAVPAAVSLMLFFEILLPLTFKISREGLKKPGKPEDLP
jgi:hypothetical protein